MLPYFILVGVPFFIQIFRFSGVDKKKLNKFSIAIFFLLLFCLLAFRDKSIGTDTPVYVDYFKDIKNWSWGDIFSNDEFLYWSLVKIISIFTSNEQWFLIITSLFIVLPMAIIYIKEAEEDSLITIVLFISLITFSMIFTGIRQSIAMGLGFITYSCSKKKHFIRFVLSVAIAFFFHKSAIILVLMYPLCNLKITIKWLYFVVPIAVFMFIFNRQILEILVQFMPDYYEKYGNSFDGGYLTLIMLLLFCIFSFIVVDNENLSRDFLILRNLLLMSTFIALFGPVNIMVGRFGYYFILFVPILIPKIIDQATDNCWKIVELARYVIFLFFILYFFITGFNQMSAGSSYFPYYFFWEK